MNHITSLKLSKRLKKLGMFRITKFQPTVGSGDKLWDEGWGVRLIKFGFIKFLLWERPIPD